MRKLLFLLIAAAPLTAQVAPTTPAQNPATAATTAPSASATSAPWGLIALAPQAADDSTAKKAKQLLEKMIGALGGDAYLKYETVTQHGRSYAFYQGNPNSRGTEFWRYYKFPDKERVELTKDRDVIYVTVGNEGYEITYKGTAEQEREALAEALRRRDHSLEVILREWLKDPKTLVIYSGTATANQRLVDLVTLISQNNDSATIAIDSNDTLPIRRTYTYRNPVDKIKDEEGDIYANYRMVQGIMTPHTISRTKNDQMTNQRFVNDVQYNVPIEDSKFAAKVTYDPYKLSPKR